MGKVAWTEKAIRHLKTIREYIAKDSPIYASRFIKSLINATNPLVGFPRMGRLVPEFNSDLIREIIHQNYRIIMGTKEKELPQTRLVLHSRKF